MIVEVRKNDPPEKIDQELKKILDRSAQDKKDHFEKFFGILTLNEDPLALQRKWRDEW